MSPTIEHQDDMFARIELRHELREMREGLELSTEAVARLAGFPYAGTVRDLERKTSWEIWRVQQWARGLEVRLFLNVVGLTVPEPDTTALVLAATVAFGALDEDQLHLRQVVHDLIRTREAAGITRVNLSRKCGVDERAFRDFEADPTRSWLRTWQRYVRGVGGELHLELTPVPAEVAS